MKTKLSRERERDKLEEKKGAWTEIEIRGMGKHKGDGGKAGSQR